MMDKIPPHSVLVHVVFEGRQKPIDHAISPVSKAKTGKSNENKSTRM